MGQNESKGLEFHKEWRAGQGESLGSTLFEKVGTFQNRAKVVDSFCGDGSCLAGGFPKTVNWNLKGARKCFKYQSTY